VKFIIKFKFNTKWS